MTHQVEIKSGVGWRIGWNAEAREFQGLVGNDDWAIELTKAEFNDFCRLLENLAAIMSQMAAELMVEEKIACEAESEYLWMQVEGYPDSYNLCLIVNQGRRCEGFWDAPAVKGLREGVQQLQVWLH